MEILQENTVDRREIISDYLASDLIVKGQTVDEYFRLDPPKTEPDREEFLSLSSEERIEREKNYRVDQVNSFLRDLETAITGNQEANPDYNNDELLNFIEILRGNKQFPEGYSNLGGRFPPGIVGIGAFSILHLFIEATNFPSKWTIAYGRTRDYVFHESKKSGHLAVETMFEHYYSYDAYRDGIVDMTERYHWDVEVPDGLYEIRGRKGDAETSPYNPFPDTVNFPYHALNPKDKRSIWYRDLKSKLFARGETITVRHVYKQLNNDPIIRIPESNHSFYKSDKDSCVDMMFENHPPPFDLPRQSSYCLGRCRHPNIFNTSGGGD